MFAGLIALLMSLTLGLTLTAVTHAQTPVARQTARAQSLQEYTLTAEYKSSEGFLLRGGYRRDYSNLPFFLTDLPGVLKKEQNTATLGLVWWWGRKEGGW